MNEVARMTGISVRTLHHYDAIGLLVPARTESGYRVYDDAALFRLQQILIGRELGLPLEEIRRGLDDPTFDRRRALVEQRALLASRVEQTAQMIRSIDRALAALEEPARKEEGLVNMKDIFDGFDPAKYEAEAEARWGNTAAYEESARRTKSYSKEDWARLKAEQSAIYEEAARWMKEGVEPTDERAMDVAERARLAIDRWFYPCSHAMHRALADMYEADERFAQNIDRYGEGLTPFLSAAIRANAARQGG